MNLLLHALLKLITEKSIYIESGIAKHQLQLRIEAILKSMQQQGWKWTISEVFKSVTYTIGKERTYKVVRYLQKNYGNELTSNEDAEITQRLSEIRKELNQNGIIIKDDDIKKNDDNHQFIDSRFPSHSTKKKSVFDHYYTNNNSYSGSDIVASITLPGKGPLIFGELSNISYSVLREKVPVRAMGRVSMKGYTRGMRTITGILTFTVFDDSIVYRCMKELKEKGYKMLMDEMPLFDITLTMANEFGSRSSLTIYGVSTYTEGMVMSVNDMMTQNVYEFYALDIDPIAKQR